MLKTDEAAKRLKELRAPKWIDQRLASLAKHPEKIRFTARAILNRDKTGKELDYAASMEARAKAAAHYESMSAAERLKLFTAIFGDLAPYVSRAWDNFQRLPYKFGYTRKPFRVPGGGAELSLRRGVWIAGLAESLQGFAGHQTIEWVAAWAPHLGYHQDDLGLLLAAAIDAGGETADRVMQVLKDSASNQHEVGQFGRHVTRALLTSSNPDAWDFMEKMLLAAQRQEGLRQTILETIDEAHPDAFRRMLRLILEHNLERFSATVRAFDTWFAMQWDAVSTKVVTTTLQNVIVYLDDEKARKKAIDGADPEQTFLALWATAFDDAGAMVPLAAGLLKDKRVEKRFIAVHMLALVGLQEAKTALLPALDDADLRVAARALDAFRSGYDAEDYDEDDEKQKELAAKKGDLFERLERLIARIPEKSMQLKPIVWPWIARKLEAAHVADLLDDALGDRPPTRLIPYLEKINPYRRAGIVKKLTEGKKFDAAVRDLLLKLVTDNHCRDEAIAGLRKCKITDDEAQSVEALLSRKSGDLRRGVVGLLESQSDAAVMTSADRLLAAKDGLQRLAGLELLRRLVEAKRLVDKSRAAASAFKASAKKVSKDETTHLEAILDENRSAETLDDALGLLDHSKRTAPVEPKKKPVVYCSPAAREILLRLDELVHEHREKSIFIPDWKYDRDIDDDDDEIEFDEENSDTEKPALTETPKGTTDLLGNVRWGFPSPRPKLELEQDLGRLPLREVWERFWNSRGPKLRDKDGFEALRAEYLLKFAIDADDDDDELGLDDDDDKAPHLDAVLKQTLAGVKRPKLQYTQIVGELVSWLLRMMPPPRAADFLLDGLESLLASVPKDKLAEKIKDWNDEPIVQSRWRDRGAVEKWKETLSAYLGLAADEWTDAHHVRYFRLMRWWDEPTGNTSGLPIARERPSLDRVLAAYKAGGATEADIIDQLLGKRDEGAYGPSGFNDLERLTAAKPPKVFKEIPALAEIALRCRERVLQVELKRGDAPTAATEAAKDLKCSGGLDTLARVLVALGADKLQRGTRWGDDGKPGVFAHLIRASLPFDGDTPEAFAARMKPNGVAPVGVTPERLVEVAVYAPQWAAHVEHTIGWKGLEDAIWWLHAHTRDRQWGVADDVKSKWKSAVGQRTPLAAKDLLDGAVDVAWFHRSYETFGKQRWGALYEAAKFASGGTGHKRAQLFADAMLGREKRADLITRVRDKRNQDAVRALGLLPLPPEKGALTEKGRKDLHERYKVLAEFLRTSRQFGSMRQASEKRATAIGMENLARTAGYPDPVRLQWAMEAEETKDLAKGPVTAKAGDIAVTLSIDDDGKPQIAAQNLKTQRTLASVPPAAKKDKKVAELLSRKTDLRRTSSRVRQSLEQAMCRGDVFAGFELRDLFANPMLSPLLARVVFVGEGILGYPVDGGKGLADFAGKIEPVKKDERLRIAHPVDLLATDKWDKWQHDCFTRERVQPFKQVFRELYTLTKSEKAEGDLSRRYAGHQVNPRQAVALLTGRGWLVAPEQGVSRTFHELGLTAWISFQESFHTPAEVEGLTLEGVHFTKRGEWTDLQLAKIDPRIFSEVMRDVDLVVSVAHRGGVDPEASASTVQMRTALLRETLDLLKLKNVRLKENHALVKGELADYTVHLGSAGVHRQPGGALHIVAVHSQHRGRMFLPFADDDPKTAEVISKVLLLARDKEIQDPNLLSQIRG